MSAALWRRSANYQHNTKLLWREVLQLWFNFTQPAVQTSSSVSQLDLRCSLVQAGQLASPFLSFFLFSLYLHHLWPRYHPSNNPHRKNTETVDVFSWIVFDRENLIINLNLSPPPLSFHLIFISLFFFISLVTQLTLNSVIPVGLTSPRCLKKTASFPWVFMNNISAGCCKRASAFILFSEHHHRKLVKCPHTWVPLEEAAAITH